MRSDAQGNTSLGDGSVPGKPLGGTRAQELTAVFPVRWDGAFSSFCACAVLVVKGVKKNNNKKPRHAFAKKEMLKAQTKTVVTKSPHDRHHALHPEPRGWTRATHRPQAHISLLRRPLGTISQCPPLCPVQVHLPSWALNSGRSHLPPEISKGDGHLQRPSPARAPAPPLPAQGPQGSLTNQLLWIRISSKMFERKEGRIEEKKQGKGGREQEVVPCPPCAHPMPTLLHPSLRVSVSQRPANTRPGPTHPIPSDMSTGFSSSMSTWKALFMF